MLEMQPSQCYDKIMIDMILHSCKFLFKDGCIVRMELEVTLPWGRVQGLEGISRSQ